jgi:hypothetical protein
MKIDNVVCKIRVGDQVEVRPLWGPSLAGKVATVTKVERYINCESGFMVSIDIYDRPLDANWFILLPNSEQSPEVSDTTDA